MPLCISNINLRPTCSRLTHFGTIPMLPRLFEFGIIGKLYLNKQQLRKMPAFFGDVRFVWNQTLEWLKGIYDARKAYCKKHQLKLYDKNHKRIKKNFKKLPKMYHFPSKVKFNKFLNHLKHTYKWLKYADGKALQNEVYNLRDTFLRMFKHLCNCPHFKSRKSHYQSYMTDSATVLGSNFFLTCHRGKLPKLGKVKVHFDKKYKHIHNIKEVTVMLKPNGQYYVGLTVQSDKQALPKTGKSVGIDVGRASLIILSDGQKFDYKDFGQALHAKHVKWQRRSQRRRLRATKIIRMNNHIIKQHQNAGLYTPHDADLKTHYYEFHNYVKARQQAAKLFQKVRNQRKDYLQKITTYIVRHYDFIAIEDLDVEQMLTSRKTISSREISGAAWRMFRTILTYKCKWYGKELVAVNPNYTSQICYYCLTWSGKHPVSQRYWYCSNKHCKYNKTPVDRDLCSAKLILKLGYHEISPSVYRQIPKYKHSSPRQLKQLVKTTVLSKQTLISKANNPLLQAKARDVPHFAYKSLRNPVNSEYATEAVPRNHVAKGHPYGCPLL